MLYQPRIKDELIRKLYFFAKREKRPMTKVLNQIVENALVHEPDPPPYERRRRQLSATHDSINTAQ